MAGLVPNIGAKGLFTLRVPFVLDSNLSYTCSSHRTIDEIIASGENPYELIYKPVGLPETEVNLARERGIVIVTLLSGVTKPVYVPSDYITAYDNTALVPHQYLVVTAPCGIFPVGYDATRIKEAVRDALVAYVGIEVEPLIVVKDMAGAVTQQMAKSAEDARYAAMTYTSTTLGDKLELQNRVQILEDENAKLIEIIEQLQGP